MIINRNFHEIITRKYGMLKHRQPRSPALIFLSLNRTILSFHRLLNEITILRQHKNISHHYHYHHYYHYHNANYPVILNLFSRIFPVLSKEYNRQELPLEKNFFHFPNLYKFMRTHITTVKSLSFPGKLPLVDINREATQNFYRSPVLSVNISREATENIYRSPVLVTELAKGLKKPGAVEAGTRNTPQQNRQESKTCLTVVKPLSFAGNLLSVNINREIARNIYRFPVLFAGPAKGLKKPGAVDAGKRDPHQQNQQESETYLSVAKPLGLPGKFQPIHLEVIHEAMKFKKSFCGVQGRFFQKEPLAAGGKKNHLLLEPPIVLKKTGLGQRKDLRPYNPGGATVPALKHFNPSAVVRSQITETVHRVKENIIQGETITKNSVVALPASQYANAEAPAKEKKTVNAGQLTEQVYRMLLHKIKIEKERRGL